MYSSVHLLRASSPEQQPIDFDCLANSADGDFVYDIDISGGHDDVYDVVASQAGLYSPRPSGDATAPAADAFPALPATKWIDEHTSNTSFSLRGHGPVDRTGSFDEVLDEVLAVRRLDEAIEMISAAARDMHFRQTASDVLDATALATPAAAPAAARVASSRAEPAHHTTSKGGSSRARTPTKKAATSRSPSPRVTSPSKARSHEGLQAGAAAAEVRGTEQGGAAMSPTSATRSPSRDLPPCSHCRPRAPTPAIFEVQELRMDASDYGRSRQFEGRILTGSDIISVKIPRRGTGNRLPRLPLRLSLTPHYDQLQSELESEYSRSELRQAHDIHLVFGNDAVARQYQACVAMKRKDHQGLVLSGVLRAPLSLLDSSRFAGYDMFAQLKTRVTRGGKGESTSHFDEQRLQWHVGNAVA
jgi:hypothetical protein